MRQPHLISRVRTGLGESVRFLRIGLFVATRRIGTDQTRAPKYSRAGRAARTSVARTTQGVAAANRNMHP
jgi:hypothetical protein